MNINVQNVYRLRYFIINYNFTVDMLLSNYRLILNLQFCYQDKSLFFRKKKPPRIPTLFDHLSGLYILTGAWKEFSSGGGGGKDFTFAQGEKFILLPFFRPLHIHKDKDQNLTIPTKYRMCDKLIYPVFSRSS